MTTRSRSFSIPVVVLATVLLLTGRAEAQQYSFQTFGLDQGLTNLGIKGLHQDRQGFLWVSTENGIFRYDGERFQPFGAKEGLPISSAVAFGDAPDGSLLVGGDIGLFRKVGERFQQIPMPGAKSVSWYSGIQWDGKGTTWIATDAGLMALSTAPGGAGFTAHLAPKPAEVEKPNAFGLLVENHAVWYGCDAQLCEYKNGKVTVFGVKAGVPLSRWKGIRRAGNGDLWAQGRSDIALLRAGSTRFEKPESPSHSAVTTGVSVDSAGRIIFGTNDGLVIGDRNSWKSVGHESGLKGTVYCAMQDREGSLWIGLLGRGLVRWAGYREWEAFTSDSGLASDIVYEMRPMPDGTVWAGTEDGLFRGRKSHDAWTWQRQPQPGRVAVHSVRPDGAGRLWLGTESKGAARFNPATGRIEWFTEKQGLSGKNPYTLTLDRSQRIWAATERGLFVADLKRLKFRLVEQVPPIQIWTVIEAANGDIWAGSVKGLFRLSQGHLSPEQWSHLTSSDGLRHDVVLSLAAAKNGDVWVGYRFGGGIDYIRMASGEPEIRRPAHEPGGKPATVYFLGFDSRQRLWAGTDQGVDVWDGSEWSHYDRRDGLIWDDCDLNGFAAGADGSVWIGTSGGLARFTPQVSSRPDVPEVIYTKVTLGKGDVDPAAQPSVDHGSNMLHAKFSALTFARESSVLFRYRLTPLFDEWRETRQRELQFDGIVPGAYRLEILARDGWGRWSAKPAVFSFQVMSPWWRRPWAYPILLGIPLGLVVLMVRLRMAAMRHRERQLMVLVEDRTAELKQANEDLLGLSRVEHEKNLAEEQRAHAEEVARLNRRAIETLALAIEAKDQTTGDHLHRVEVYAVGVAQEMGLDDAQLEALRAAALLHDVGKLAVPEYIISKPGRLTPDEFNKMKTHTVVGAEIVERIRFPYPVAPIVRSHHEKWDGSGYPDGLAGEQIPIGGRILAAVDCLDALASDRQYRRALPLDEAIRIVQAEAGKSFDPAVVAVLARRYAELERMARRSGELERTRLSVDLQIARGESPAAGFEATAPSASTSSTCMHRDLTNLRDAINGTEEPERALVDLTRRMASCGDRAALFGVLRQSLRTVVPYDVMAIYLRRGDHLVPEGSDGEDSGLFASVEIPLGMGLSGWVAENRKSSINGNPAVEPGYLKDPGRFSGLRSALAVPLEDGERMEGVLSLYRKEQDAFSPEHLTRLTSLGTALAGALSSTHV